MTGNNFYFEPSVIEKTPYGERSYDVYSRLLKDRVVFLRGEVNEALADAPETLNSDPYGAWVIKVSPVTDTEELLDAAAYEAHCAAEEG